MTSDDIILQWMCEEGLPLTRGTYRFVNWFGCPPAYMSAEEAASIPAWLPERDPIGEAKARRAGRKRVRP
jgi:hypothetical protein